MNIMKVFNGCGFIGKVDDIPVSVDSQHDPK